MPTLSSLDSGDSGDSGTQILQGSASGNSLKTKASPIIITSTGITPFANMKFPVGTTVEWRLDGLKPRQFVISINGSEHPLPYEETYNTEGVYKYDILRRFPGGNTSVWVSGTVEVVVRKI